MLSYAAYVSKCKVMQTVNSAYNPDNLAYDPDTLAYDPDNLVYNSDNLAAGRQAGRR